MEQGKKKQQLSVTLNQDGRIVQLKCKSDASSCDPAPRENLSPLPNSTLSFSLCEVVFHQRSHVRLQPTFLFIRLSMHPVMNFLNNQLLVESLFCLTKDCWVYVTKN